MWIEKTGEFVYDDDGTPVSYTPADPRYLDQAFEALAYEYWFTKYNPSPDEVLATEAEWVNIVRRELALIQEQTDYQLWLESNKPRTTS